MYMYGHIHILCIWRSVELRWQKFQDHANN